MHTVTEGRGGPAARVAAAVGVLSGGEVRTAILLLLSDELMHGYQIMQAMSERTGGAWHLSWGAIDRTIAELEDEGLVMTREEAAAAWSLHIRGGVHNWRSAAPN